VRVGIVFAYMDNRSWAIPIKFARMIPRAAAAAWFRVPQFTALGFCACEGHPLGSCSLPSRGMLEPR
jgi:hypothetical protein